MEGQPTFRPVEDEVKRERGKERRQGVRGWQMERRERG